MGIYRKRYMTITELVKQGIPKSILYEIAHTPNQKIAFRYNEKGSWHFDTTLIDNELTRRATQ